MLEYAKIVILSTILSFFFFIYKRSMELFFLHNLVDLIWTFKSTTNMSKQISNPYLVYSIWL